MTITILTTPTTMTIMMMMIIMMMMMMIKLMSHYRSMFPFRYQQFHHLLFHLENHYHPFLLGIRELSVFHYHPFLLEIRELSVFHYQPFLDDLFHHYHLDLRELRFRHYRLDLREYYFLHYPLYLRKIREQVPYLHRLREMTLVYHLKPCHPKMIIATLMIIIHDV